MGTCIICGNGTDGEVCDTHEQDVAFVFEGTSADQLAPGRYYRGTVDGYADFGVFVDVGERVTGLLHESELDQRLESLSWDPGDEVFVQVDDVRDNGNVDLSWSIRQAPEEFRGLLIDAPEGERRPESDDEQGGAAGTDESRDASGAADPADADGADEPDDADRAAEFDAAETDSETGSGADAGESDGTDPAEEVGEVRQRQSDGGTATGAVAESDRPAASGRGGSTESTASASAEDGAQSGGDEPAGTDADDAAPADDGDAEPERAAVEELSDSVGVRVRVEGEVVGAHQTSGPTVFTVRDGTGTVECAAFDGAGIRAYPEVDVGDYVRLDGEVELRRGDVQVETETLLVLTGEEREAVAADIDAAVEAEVRPDGATFVAEDDPASPLADGLVEAATAIRRAVVEDRPVVIRHRTTADGYAAGAAVERAAFQRARAAADGAEPDYHAVDRRPLDDRVYGMDAVTGDVSRVLEDRERHDEQLPLLVLVGLGSSEEAVEAAPLLDAYDVDRLVLDVARPDEGVEGVGDPVVNPHLVEGADDCSTAALGSALGATVAPGVTGELVHVPAIGYWDEPPEAYVRAADEAGVDADERRAIREALALEAHYQSYNDKRELVDDVLFGSASDLAEHVAEQFREKLDTELATARENLVVRETDGVHVGVLDTDAFTHRFDFPPTDLLLDELHRETVEGAGGPVVTVGAGEDELAIRSTAPVDVRAVAERASESVSGIDAVGGRDGHVEYLAGVREEAIEAVVAAVTAEIQP